GEGISYDFTIDRADRGKQLWITFEVDATDANYVADDMLVYIYDVNNMQLITPSVTGIKAAYYKFEASFITSDKLSYRLIIHQATTNANVVVLYFDDFK